MDHYEAIELLCADRENSSDKEKQQGAATRFLMHSFFNNLCRIAYDLQTIAEIQKTNAIRGPYNRSIE